MNISELSYVKKNEPMSAHTTFRTGGAAELFAEPESEKQLAELISAARAENIALTVVGNGSNLLVKDGGIRGLVIHLGRKFAKIKVCENIITAQSGALLSQTAAAALEHSLCGLEFAAGIPGTVGGGIYMNAGAYGGSLSDVVVATRAICGGEIREFSRDEMQLGYRKSIFAQNGAVVTGVSFELAPGSREEIAAKMRELAGKRRDKQPLEFASAGSTFKRPEGHFAGALIEAAGLKGLSVGAAQVSEKHAGFIINRGGATSADILGLIGEVQRRVFAHSGVMLEPEVRIIGEDA